MCRPCSVRSHKIEVPLEVKTKLHKPADRLLITKLSLPSLRPDLVPRRRLLDQLSGIDRQKLVLLVAPAGYGKTTLLGQWAREQAQSVAWLSLDAKDNDPVRFWSHVVGALHSLHAEVGAQTLQWIRSGQDSDTEEFLESLINDLATQRCAGALVLDDYDLIHNPRIHDGVGLLLEHAPIGLHLAVATRHEPPLPLARLRARGQMLELGTPDMRFTMEEAGAFLGETFGLHLPAEALALLERRTEGWPAGLQLAALSLQRSGDPSAFLHAFDESRPLIVRYLADEVLKGQPEEIQTFLMQTSILDRMNPALCNALTGRRNAARILDQIHRANLFIVPLDAAGHWYRYHELFSGLLRDRLRQMQPESISALHRKASHWYEGEGLTEEAVEHALRAGEFELAVRLLHQVLGELLARGEVHQVLQWLPLLPGELIDSDAEVCLLFASAQVLRGRFDQTESMLQVVESLVSKRRPKQLDPAPAQDPQADSQGNFRKPKQAGDSALLAWADFFRAFMMRFRDVHQAVFLSQKALDHVPDGEPEIRSRALLCLGHANLLVGDHYLAEQMLMEVRDACLAPHELPIYYSAVDYLAQLRVLQGRLREAKILYQEAMRRANPGRPVFSGIDRIGYGNLLREWNDLAGARHHIERGLEMAEMGGDFVFIRSGYVALSALEQAYGNFEASLGLLQRAQDLLKRGNMIAALAPIAAMQAQLLLHHGNLAAARQWAESFRSSVDEPLNYSNSLSFLVFSEVLVADQDYDRALALLNRLLNEAGAGGYGGLVIELLIRKSLALAGSRDREGARDVLCEALGLAKPEYYVRAFLDCGRPMAELLLELRRGESRRKIALSNPGLPRYINDLLSAFDVGRMESPAEKGPSSRIPGSFQSLTGRERQILKLVAEGLPNRDIARDLVISDGTVRRHMHNICNKLGARNRTEALARARDSRLL
jgi:ATP/maltotriose-dependent transcriptional regulator MalT